MRIVRSAVVLSLLSTTACVEQRIEPASQLPDGDPLASAKTTAQAPDAEPAADLVQADGDMIGIVYPQTRKGDVVETIHGVTVADPYRWLENDVREDAEVAQWVEAQNEVSGAFLDALPGTQWFKERMTALYDYERIGVPTSREGAYFYSKNDGLQPQSVLYVRRGLDGDERVLIDPNTWSDDGATALAEYVPSEDGSKLLYAIQDGGSDWRTLKVLDVATGEILEDTIEWVKFSSLDWAKDGSGFYYSRFPASEEGGKFIGLNTNQAVYFHRLGTSQDDDQLVFARPDNPDLNNTATVSDDGRYLITSSSTGTDGWETAIIDLATNRMKAVVIEPGVDYETSYVGNDGSTFFFQTNRDAQRGGIFKVDIDDPELTRTWVIPEDQAVLIDADHVGGRLIAQYLVDVKSEARIYDMDGTMLRTVDLPGIGSAGGFGGSPENSETFYSFSSFGRPSTIYRYDIDSGTSEVWAAPEVAFDPDNYVTEQVFYTSKDGTRIPMFITKRADVTGPVPTLLYGYGGFNISVRPGFSPTRIAWMDAGGAYAVANIRGGGEYGKAWHDGGRRFNKQNVFDDFAAAGEWLKDNGVTTADGLAIEGRSNGGLLVGASINQRPDLFDAGHAAVGVMDMVRFDQFTAGRYWVDDYNYPAKERDFKYNLTFSPYHNVKAKIDYPAVLVTTADTDDRVVPGHSFKYVAMLQEKAGPGDEPLLIRIETRAGHGSGKPTDKIIEEAADVAAFLAHFTGLKTPQGD